MIQTIQICEILLKQKSVFAAALIQVHFSNYTEAKMYHIARNVRSSKANRYFIMKHSQLPVMDLIVTEIIKHEIFAAASKTAKSTKVSSHESFVVYSTSYFLA